VQQIDSSNSLAAVGLVLHKPGHMRVLVGNLTGEPQIVKLRGLSGNPVAIQVLGATASQTSPELAISLPPHGIARIDRVVE